MAINNKIRPQGFTFDDVLLVPAYSEVLPREVSTQSILSKNITLNIPLISAAMDTVTEAKLAIALAHEGGIGILHKNMSIAQQVDQIKKVKRSESGLIIDPITLSPNAIIGDAIKLMNQHNIGGIPIVDDKQKLVGILTNRDLRFQKNHKLPIHEVMTKNVISVLDSTSIEQVVNIFNKHKIHSVPVINYLNKYLIGIITSTDILIHLFDQKSVY